MIEEHTRYSRLAQTTKLINTKLELREVLEHVVTAISDEIFRCDSVGIYLPQNDGTYRGYVGKPELLNSMTLDMLVINPETDLLAKEVLEKKESIYIPDTSKDSRPDPGPIKAFKMNSLLSLPINYEDEVYGLVFLFNHGEHMNLTEAEIQSVEAYVNMAAVAIRNANNLTRKENLISEKQLLLDVTRELSLCSTMNEVLDKCFYYVGRVLKNTNIGAHLLDPIAGNLFKPASLSKESDWTEEAWKKTHSIIKIDQSTDRLFQEVIQTKKALFVPDVFSDPRPNHEACRTFGIKGVLMLPIVTMGKILGLLAIVNLDEKDRVYPQADIQLAQSIVEATASVLSHLIYMEKQELIIKERTIELIEKNQELEDVVGELQRLSREKELILNSAGDGIVGLDIEGNITFCNPAAETILGYIEKELIGRSYESFFSKAMTSIKHTSLLKCSKEATIYTDETFIRKDGSKFPAEFAITSIKEKQMVIGYVVTFKDITIRKQMEEKINYHAYYDSLTNLPNRLLLQDRLNQGLAYAQLHKEQLAVLFLDLDRFKTINDTLGHSYGDLLLQKVAERLSHCAYKGCTVSRQGGDEFTIILPIVRCEKEVKVFSENVIAAFEEPFDLKGNEIFVKTSIGISLYPQDGVDAEDLIKKADTAMYKSKELAGNEYQFYTSAMDNHTLENVKLENSLYKALDFDELRIYYQPQYDNKNKRIFGVEALLRWEHRTKGMISPGEFIPLAEETGLIVPIGEWVLRNACKQLKEWQMKGYPEITVSVNVSAQQFNKPHFVNMVKEIIDETQLSPHFLELELTENLIIQNTEETLHKMSRLKDLGIKISIDDFGTGYSSLGYLKNFPINTLKIDRSFIKDVCHDPKNAAITNTIITLAHNLNLHVIAEGVESLEQIEFLSLNDCFRIQGYYYSRPIKPYDLVETYF
ncbi:bifunctional diguanylate cyclase/phosphodiesterase [Metabacillus bambusae]|uniref:EAL domain-containing protein n=1 Tax=Metabacillus bambusae TaxID=2795218 RepID=A0ABS3N349_9BACI|nr:EAL domain-containing protein [Metabacillus bambusae]MBO1512593.1 EAL domain-containing protein [Metabacillus bambusae]